MKKWGPSFLYVEDCHINSFFLGILLPKLFPLDISAKILEFDCFFAVASFAGFGDLEEAIVMPMFSGAELETVVTFVGSGELETEWETTVAVSSDIISNSIADDVEQMSPGFGTCLSVCLPSSKDLVIFSLIAVFSFANF